MTEWTQYHHEGFADHDDAADTSATGGASAPLDPTKYENQARQTGRFTATVWAVHVNVPTFLVKFVLTVISMGRQDLGLTHEYSTGDSWADWGQPAANSGDNHLVVYFTAPAWITARRIGRRIAEITLGASVSSGAYAISTAGDYRQLIEDTRRREVERAPAAEAEGQSGQ